VPYRWYHTFVRKTTIYLEQDEAEGLRRLASQTGKSQAELIREGVRSLLSQPHQRIFRSMNAGRSSGDATGGWEAADVYKRVMGQR